MSHSAENFREGTLLFLRKILVSKSFMDEKEGITFFHRKFLVSQCRKISWASLQCFRKYGVSKNFMSKSWILRFSMLSHSTEKRRRGTLLCFTKFLVSKKFMDKRGGGGGVSRFSVNNSLSHSAEKFRRGTLQCVTNFGYRKISCFRELCHDFVPKFFVSQCRKKS